ncbi:MAG: class I SAM-dependent methyltransferase [Lachnospiraceae bacterium]|nr:class I SAM-dependent methyltransferase [Lachnospiraceae bacterium]
MWTADRWKDYKLIDASDGERLELWGKYVLVRPDPQVIWKTPREDGRWKRINAHYHRSSKGGGEWEFFDLPEEWSISYDDLKFRLKPFSFKHTGLFPEQAVNWDWMAKKIHGAKRQIRVLNLFAYTGGATLSCAAAGAHVTHVDASKGIISWAKENVASSALPTERFRWIAEDCRKFAEREIRRGNTYDAIIMDPPSYGRGTKGEVWKMEENIYSFLELAEKLLSEKPLFVLLNSYTTGLQASVLTYLLESVFSKGRKCTVISDEVGLPVMNSGLVLPCGACGRVTF